MTTMTTQTENKTSRLDKWNYFFTGAALTGLAHMTINHYSGRIIPSTAQVQEGSIAPSRLEIKCQDIDKNNVPETILQIDDKRYLLREVDGKPVLSTYEVKIEYK